MYMGKGAYLAILSLPTSPRPDAFPHCWARYLGI